MAKAQATPPLPPHTIAVIVDGVVEDVIRTQDRFAAILLSNPTFAYADGVHAVISQTTYDPKTGEFSHPDETVEKSAKEFTLSD